jgi:hypothetical protein
LLDVPLAPFDEVAGAHAAPAIRLPRPAPGFIIEVQTVLLAPSAQTVKTETPIPRAVRATLFAMTDAP